MGEILFVAAGFVTELNRRVKVADHKLWGSQCLFTNPGAEIETHREFLKCGVDILVTNTYQASVQGFKNFMGLDETKGYELIKKSVSYCKEAIRLEREAKTLAPDKRILIAGSVGSFGAYLADGSEYNGSFIEHYSSEKIEQWHQPRIEALVEGGVDLLTFETLPSVHEAKILLKLLGKFPSMKGLLLFSAKDGSHIGHGELFQEVAAECWSTNPTQLLAIGINCTAASIATELISRLPKHIPPAIYPNCGLVWDAKEKVWTNPTNSEDKLSSAEWAQKWCEMGVKYMGLCCGSSMESRRKIREVIDKFHQQGNDSY